MVDRDCGEPDLQELNVDSNDVMQSNQANMFGGSSLKYTMDSEAFLTLKYPYPASVNVSNLIVIKLNSTNYLVWEAQLLNLIESVGFTGFLDGSIKELPKTVVVTKPGLGQEVQNMEYLAWKRSDRLLKGWITSTLSKEIVNLLWEMFGAL